MFVKFPDGHEGYLSVNFEKDGEGYICATAWSGTAVVVYMTSAQFEALGKVLLGHVKGSAPLPLQGSRRNLQRLEKRVGELEDDRCEHQMQIRSLEKERADLQLHVRNLQSSVAVLGKALAEKDR